MGIGTSCVECTPQYHRPDGSRSGIERPGKTVESGKSAQAKVTHQQVGCYGRFDSGGEGHERSSKATRRKTARPSEEKNAQRSDQVDAQRDMWPEKSV